jgi:hypothetical protein
LLINLTPFIPLSLKGEGEIVFKRGANAPLKHPIHFQRERKIVFKRGANAPLKHPIHFQREGEEILERGEAPLLLILPLPLPREGGQGDRLLGSLWLKLIYQGRFWRDKTPL